MRTAHKQHTRRHHHHGDRKPKRRSAADDRASFQNPLVTRYASAEMVAIWGSENRYSTWRRIWIALAEAQHELG